jgi:hypothetical protein
VEVFGIQPGAQAGIVNVGVAVPEIRGQGALDLEVIEMQFNERNVPREMALHVARAYVEAGDAAGFPLCFHNHTHPFRWKGMR